MTSTSNCSAGVTRKVPLRNAGSGRGGEFEGVNRFSSIGADMTRHRVGLAAVCGFYPAQASDGNTPPHPWR